MAEHRGAVKAPVMVGVGAAFDVHSGEKREAPRWLRPIGLEWLYRLLYEPRRLWRRYLINNPLFAIRVLRSQPFLRYEGEELRPSPALAAGGSGGPVVAVSVPAVLGPDPVGDHAETGASSL